MNKNYELPKKNTKKVYETEIIIEILQATKNKCNLLKSNNDEKLPAVKK